jgi:hypothetical protein
MAEDEEQLAAMALSNMLTSAMMRAYDIEHRSWLYLWERDGYRWLLRFRERRPDGVMCAWSSRFIDLNRDVILADGGNVDWNLRAARLARDAIKTE